MSEEKANNDISKALNLAPISGGSVVENKKFVKLDETDREQLEDDIEAAREYTYDALQKSKEVVDDMLIIAKQSQHPKAYEILNSAIKTMAEIAQNLTDEQIKKQKLKPSVREEGGDVINNNLFVGDTAELMKMLEGMKQNKDE